MSNRPCNFCVYRDIKTFAGNQEIKIVLHPIKFCPKGVDVLVGGYKAAWFAELPKRCACGE